MVHGALHSINTGVRTFLGRLGADRGGNVLVIAAACIPLMLILGGVDMSRASMTQYSLQSACVM